MPSIPFTKRFCAIFLLLVAAIMFGCSAESVPTAESGVQKLVVPVHYRGSPKGEVLARLCAIGSERSEILLGQNIGCTSDDTVELRDALKSVSILNRDGSYPAVVGIDYGWGDKDRESIRAANRLLIAHWKRGGLITINFDPGNPLTGIPDPNDITPIDVYRLCEAGTEENISFSRQLETVADGLQELQRAGVVVLWRPIHEPNGGWFWWCSHDPDSNRWTSPKEYRMLWKYIHRELTKTYGLDNLLWVYSPAAMTDASIRPTDWYYPGDDFVDVIGIDLYTDHLDRSHVDARGGYSRLRKYGKPMAICEIGGRTHDGRMDTMACLDAVLECCPDAKYMLFWHSWGPASDRSRVAIQDCRNPTKLMNDPRVLLVRDDDAVSHREKVIPTKSRTSSRRSE
ncbi:MAG: hypothetical protein FJ308_20105 [Planctomycetes bacterium]|nr:hypothetical protein [Planctomycetota bacterium]